ncbi:ATP-binding protein [Sphingomonas canadensis]|uniref:histidine kinase n=1 Tax=Sphingomonas canadensis TaxID=1219257 RepID=A0ABW3H665_9SPHN|nr:ATP-binding protein [Sphingomonas canadensis]MCW3835381.1 ATP-binding protein [Sphingomonas canadensis]
MRGALRLFSAALLWLAALAAIPGAALAQPFPKPVEDAFAAAKAEMMTDQQATLRHVAQAEALAAKLPDERQRVLALATARWLAGEAHLRSNAPDKAAPLLAQGLALVNGIREPIKLRGDLLMSQGALFMQRDQAAEALSNFQQAYYIFREVKEPRSQAIAYQNMATLYSTANDNEKAEQYLREAAELFDGDPMLSLSLHNNRGNVLLVLERYPEAEAEHLKAVEIARKLGKPLLEARVLVNLVRSQVNMRKFADAERTLARGFALIRDADAPPMLRRHLLATSARMAADRGNWRRATELIRDAFDGVDLKTTSIDYRNAHLYAHEIFSHVGEPALALQHLEALKRLNDESAKVATSTSAALMAARFDTAGREAKIATLRAEQVERAAQFQRTMFLSIGAATLVVMGALAWGLISIRRSRNKVRAANVVLGETNEALEKALKAKTEFLATTSHEIRTPLNGILGMTQVMLSDPKLDAGTRDRIGIVHGAGVTMRSLVDDILDVAKMETGNLTVDAAPMDLCATMKEVTRMWEEQARAKGLAFSLDLADAPHWIVSDAGRLRQIVFNLLSNAIKFTEKGAVSVRAAAEGEGDARRLRLEVRDSGIGIPAEKFDEIFESFKQADSGTTRRFGGTGLGLTICRNLARALGGDIAVESREGEGSAFAVDLPLVPAEAPEQEAKGAGAGTLLILDRNPIARSMLKTLFEPRFGAVKFAANPDEAAAELAAPGVTHLLVDEMTLKAAGEDPFAALAPLTRAAGDLGAQTTILWLKPDDAVRDALAAAGIGQVIEKPVAGAALVEKIISDTKENSDSPSPGPLVSRAA